jgi:hypothetical protein
MAKHNQNSAIETLTNPPTGRVKALEVGIDELIK